MSVTHTTAHGNAGSLTHWARPGIKPTTSWFLNGFISAVPQQELLEFAFFEFLLLFLLLLYSQQVEVPGPGLEPSIQQWPEPLQWQCQILNPLSKARDQTHNFMVPSRICLHCATMGTPVNHVIHFAIMLFFSFRFPVPYLKLNMLLNILNLIQISFSLNFKCASTCTYTCVSLAIHGNLLSFPVGAYV